ncbi:hypothetical protein [Priestia megaterium]|uniref:hypothetical protein n=1 Tax=Priestia megaterium TaxID=1404 RepID=UPI0008F2AFA2|nr:hypothetical protein [Priestia megaterium]MBM6602436.1 hypothetical protein [Priestia megaterium]SFH61329.1 hypothetical protein SAMN04487776_1423 [Priestia megaterium]
MSIPYTGLALQIVFVLFITVFDSWRAFIINHYSVYPPALFELSLGLLSTFLGLYGLIKGHIITFSLLVILFGILICLFFVFVYLLPEAGIPPAIPWLYSKN